MSKNDLFDLSGKNIIFAGGAGQLGFHFAKTAAEYGADVHILDVDIGNAIKKCTVLDKNIRKRINLFKIDVTSEEDIKRYYSQWPADHNLYGLVNCFHYKGNTRKLDTRSKFFAQFEDYPLEQWSSVMDVNLTGTFLMSRDAIPLLEESEGSVIINISSTYGNVSPNPFIYGDSGINSPVAYAASKAAIINLTRYMAIHLAKKKIRVNCLSPGGILNNQDVAFIKNYSMLTPLGRMSTVEDYSTAIIFMLSPQSSYLSGSNIIIDGGWTAW